ncbi:MAG: hypothetical protein RLZZ352_1268 [Pseudomonadota bacterium]|jgi:hypothetical protein
MIKNTLALIGFVYTSKKCYDFCLHYYNLRKENEFFKKLAEADERNC